MTARIAHLSDLHFGRTNPNIVAASEQWLLEQQPDLVIISGDFTQRARVDQFREARAYVERLRASGLDLLVVPGNHDVPLYDVTRRFLTPLARYRHYISHDLSPWFENDDVAILGLNTARSLTFNDGRINDRQIALLRRRFASVAANKTRILVTHHPLYALPIGKGGEWSEAVGRHENAVAAVREMGIHIALAGHYHRTYAEAADKMTEDSDGTLVIQAGTATSTRLRNDEPQSFNWLHVHHHDAIELQVIFWNGAGFERAHHVAYQSVGNNWVAQDAARARLTPTVRPSF